MKTAGKDIMKTICWKSSLPLLYEKDMRMRKISFLLLIFMLLVRPAMAMTYEEETKVSKDFIAQLEMHHVLIEDEQVVKPVQMLADRLADHIKDPLYTFKIHIINDREVNAFTIPDGHIFINLGIFLASKDLNEIAAVIGHEMGHAQMRHIPEDTQYQKPLSIATILAVIAGGLVATKNPQAGGALMYSALGGSQNIMLAHSRDHEYAADQFGMELLASSGFDPGAMSRFLVRLKTIYGTSGVPEYLMTHPYTENRITVLNAEAGEPKPDKNYWLMEAGVLGLLMPQNEVIGRAKQMPEPYQSLTLGLLQSRMGNHEQALSLLKGIDLPIANAYRGLNLYHLGKKEEAFPLLKTYAESAGTKMALADILQDKGDYAQAIEVLLPYHSEDPRVEYTLGNLYEKTAKPALSHVSYARYFLSTGKIPASQYHIDKALELKDQLPKEVVTELNSMEKTIKSLKKEGSERS